ncbi:5-hydroxytryptamine receptor 2C-like [Arapaima gigas]
MGSQVETTSPHRDLLPHVGFCGERLKLTAIARLNAVVPPVNPLRRGPRSGSDVLSGATSAACCPPTEPEAVAEADLPMTGPPRRALLGGFVSTTVPAEAALLLGRPAWLPNTSVSLNQSLAPGADASSNFSAGHSLAPDVEREKNWPALLILVIIFFTVGGNILVILAVSLEKRLQNATNFFLRSLAVADMLVGILVMPISLINILYGGCLSPDVLCPSWPQLSCREAEIELWSLDVAAVLG